MNRENFEILKRLSKTRYFINTVVATKRTTHKGVEYSKGDTIQYYPGRKTTQKVLVDERSRLYIKALVIKSITDFEVYDIYQIFNLDYSNKLKYVFKVEKSKDQELASQTLMIVNTPEELVKFIGNGNKGVGRMSGKLINLYKKGYESKDYIKDIAKINDMVYPYTEITDLVNVNELERISKRKGNELRQRIEKTIYDAHIFNNLLHENEIVDLLNLSDVYRLEIKEILSEFDVPDILFQKIIVHMLYYKVYATPKVISQWMSAGASLELVEEFIDKLNKLALDHIFVSESSLEKQSFVYRFIYIHLLYVENDFNEFYKNFNYELFLFLLNSSEEGDSLSTNEVNGSLLNLESYRKVVDQIGKV